MVSPANFSSEQPGRSNKRWMLRQISLFADLTDEQLSFLVERARLVEVERGQTIYRKGGKPDAFYGLVSGRVRITVGGEGDARRETLEMLHRGDYFGTISILTGQNHSVTAEAVNDSILIRIKRTDFEALLKKIPQLAIHLSTTLSRRLRQKDLRERTIFEPTLICLYSPFRGAGTTTYAINLAASLHKETGKKVVLVDLSPSGDAVCRAMGVDRCPSPFHLKSARFDPAQAERAVARHPSVGIHTLNIAHDLQDPADTTQVTALLSHLAHQYHFVLCDLPHALDRTAFKALLQSDLIHVTATGNRSQLHRLTEVLADFRKTIQQADERIRLVINEVDSNTDPEERTLILRRKVSITLPRLESPPTAAHPVVLAHPSWDYAKAVRRVSREIGEVQVGLVLGSGAALGLAHIGILRVLEREGIPIDVVSGSSIGALLGTFWASGLCPDRLEEIAHRFSTQGSLFRLIDLTIPKSGLFTGRRVTKLLDRHLQDKTFRDLQLPVKVVACDYVRREIIVFDEGPLTRAVRASVSIPGIFEPVKVDGRWLIDGGVLDPVPVDVLTQMGVHKVIAVNALPSPQDIHRKQAESAQAWHRLWEEARAKGRLARLLFRLRVAWRRWRNPNIFDVIMHTMQAMEYELAEAACAQADVVLHPTIPRINWWEFYNVDALIRRGQQEAEAHLDEIKKLVFE